MGTYSLFFNFRDIKQTESGLDNVERHIEGEIRRVERGVHPAEAKMAAEQIEQDLRAMEHTIQEMMQDSHVLREGRYPQASELHRRWALQLLNWSILFFFFTLDFVG